MSSNSTVHVTLRDMECESEHVPILIGCSTSTSNKTIALSHSGFVIGRSLTASYTIPHLYVSKLHCVFRLSGETWTVSNISRFGTYINNKKIQMNKPTRLLDGDELRFGLNNIRYIFFSGSSGVALPNKEENLEHEGRDLCNEMKMPQSRSSVTDHNKNQTETAKVAGRLKVDVRHAVQQSDKAKQIQQPETNHTEKLSICKEGFKKFSRPTINQTAEEWNGNVKENQIHNIQKYDKQEEIEKHAEEMRLCNEKLSKENKILQKKLKRTQIKLEEREMAEILLNKKLQEKEEQRLQDLKQQEVKNKALSKSLEAEVAAKEGTIKSRLEAEIKKLQSEKEQIENYFACEQLITESEYAKNVKRLTEELDKVKSELADTEKKNQFLEKELEHTAIRRQEQLTESSLKAKQEILQNLGQLVESELQCCICHELFVTATTLNCGHTFCRVCITLWRKKQQKRNDCPVCRVPIKSETRSIVVDTFIDKIVENLSIELLNRRQEVVQERQQSEASTSNANAASRVYSRNNEVRLFTISSDSSSESEYQVDSSTFETEEEGQLFEGSIDNANIPALVSIRSYGSSLFPFGSHSPSENDWN